MTKKEGVQRPRRRRGAILTLLVGAVLVVVTPFFGVVGALFSGIGGAIAASSGPVHVGPNANLVEVNEGRQINLLVPVDMPPPELSDCVITPPSGGTVAAYELPPLEATEVRYGDVTYVAFARLLAPEDGEYVIDCSAAETPVVASVETTGPWVLPLIWIGAAVVVVLIGAALIVIGIVRLVRVIRHNRELKSGEARMQNPAGAARSSTESRTDVAEPVVPNPLVDDSNNAEPATAEQERAAAGERPEPDAEAPSEGDPDRSP